MCVAAVIGLSLLTACAGEPAEQTLRRTIGELRQAVEQRDAGDFLDVVAEDFAGPHGMTRDDLGRMIRLQFLRHGDIGVTMGPLDVTVTGERARAGFDVLLTGGSGRLLPDQASGYAVTTGWRWDGGRWRLISAQWE